MTYKTPGSQTLLSGGAKDIEQQIKQRCVQLLDISQWGERYVSGRSRAPTAGGRCLQHYDRGI